MHSAFWHIRLQQLKKLYLFHKGILILHEKRVLWSFCDIYPLDFCTRLVGPRLYAVYMSNACICIF